MTGAGREGFGEAARADTELRDAVGPNRRVERGVPREGRHDNFIRERTDRNPNPSPPAPVINQQREHYCDRGGAGAHGPGTHACYTLCSCRCWQCCAARSEYERHRRKANGYGQSLMVDAEPIREHVTSLMCDGHRGSHHRGVGLKQIAKVSGVSHGALWKLVYGAPDRKGPSQRLRRPTAEKLLAVTLADMADGATVPSGPTVTRLQEMIDAGWAKVHLARQIGMNQSNMNATMNRTRVLAGTARAVADVHERWRSGQLPTEGRRGRGEVRR